MVKTKDQIAQSEILTRLKRIEKKLDSQGGFDKEYLSIAETSKYLSCSRVTVYLLTKEGRLTQKKIGKRRYYETAQVKALFENNALLSITSKKETKK